MNLSSPGERNLQASQTWGGGGGGTLSLLFILLHPKHTHLSPQKQTFDERCVEVSVAMTLHKTILSGQLSSLCVEEDPGALNRPGVTLRGSPCHQDCAVGPLSGDGSMVSHAGAASSRVLPAPAALWLHHCSGRVLTNGLRTAIHQLV